MNFRSNLVILHQSIEDFNASLSAQGQQLAAHLEQILSNKKIEVPMLPDVASRVLALSNDPDSDAAQLANLIQGDQALAGHVMQIANSAAYTPNSSLVSLQQAIARLGMSLITEISIAASLNAKLFKAPGFEGRISEIWFHALCTAMWGKEVARVSKQNVEASFLCGLLHSIGRPVILQELSEYACEHDISISQDEALLLEQYFHIKFGEVIVQKWGMPIIVLESVQYYEDYNDAPKNKEEAMVIHGAAMLAKVMDVEDADARLDEILSDEVFANLNLYDDEIEKLKQQAEKVKASVEAMRA